jgi:hypothetical protein
MFPCPEWARFLIPAHSIPPPPFEIHKRYKHPSARPASIVGRVPPRGVPSLKLKTSNLTRLSSPEDAGYSLADVQEQPIVEIKAYWLKQIATLKVDKARGDPAPHKPLLLLVVLDLVERGILQQEILPLKYILALSPVTDF